MYSEREFFLNLSDDKGPMIRVVLREARAVLTTSLSPRSKENGEESYFNIKSLQQLNAYLLCF